MLLYNLKLLGIGGIALKWFQSYLKNRKVNVEVGLESSNATDMETGIPPENILAPMLLTVYTIVILHITRSLLD